MESFPSPSPVVLCILMPTLLLTLDPPAGGSLHGGETLVKRHVVFQPQGKRSLLAAPGDLSGRPVEGGASAPAPAFTSPVSTPTNLPPPFSLAVYGPSPAWNLRSHLNPCFWWWGPWWGSQISSAGIEWSLLEMQSGTSLHIPPKGTCSGHCPLRTQQPVRQGGGGWCRLGWDLVGLPASALFWLLLKKKCSPQKMPR